MTLKRRHSSSSATTESSSDDEMRQLKIVDDPEMAQLRTIGGYHVGEHVIIEEDLDEGTGYHFNYSPYKMQKIQRIVKICEIHEKRGDKYAQFRIQYYFKREDILPEYHDALPDPMEDSSVEEIYRSAFSTIKSTNCIVTRAHVKNETEIEPDRHTFLCRYRFHPINRRTVFSPLTQLQVREYSDVVPSEHANNAVIRLGSEYQVEFFPRESLSDTSIQVFKNEKPEKIVDTFLLLLKCLQLAVGSIIRVWHKSHHARGLILAHNRDGTLHVELANGAIEEAVSPFQVLCLIPEDEALAMLNDCEFQGAVALYQCSNLFVKRQHEAIREFKRLAIDTTSSSRKAQKSKTRKSPTTIVEKTRRSSPRRTKRRVALKN